MTDLLQDTLPVFKVDGQVKGQLARDLSLLEIEEATDGMKTMKLVLIALGQQNDAPEQGQLYLDGQMLDFGKEIEVSIGPDALARIVFKGQISAFEAIYREGPEPHVVVYAEDALMKLRMMRRMTTWKNMTDADIAQAIASKNGITADTAAPGPTYDFVQQWNQSDLAFLRERGRLIQAEVWIEGDKLCFKTRGNRHGTSITLVQGRDILDIKLRADLAHQRSKVKVSGFDASARDRIDEEAGAEVIQAEISAGMTGPDVLMKSFGERDSYRVRETPLYASEAGAWAKAEMLRRCRSFVTAIGTTNGSADMVVGSQLNLDRVGKPFQGDGYYTVRVCHTWNHKDGFRTHFEAQRATINGAGL
jgi:phage protein D